MNLVSNWHCPVCGENVRISFDALMGTSKNRISVRVRVPDDALADVFAHAWTHEEAES